MCFVFLGVCLACHLFCASEFRWNVGEIRILVVPSHPVPQVCFFCCFRLLGCSDLVVGFPFKPPKILNLARDLKTDSPLGAPTQRNRVRTHRLQFLHRNHQPVPGQVGQPHRPRDSTEYTGEALRGGKAHLSGSAFRLGQAAVHYFRLRNPKGDGECLC